MNKVKCKRQNDRIAILTIALCNLHFDFSAGGFHGTDQRPHGFAVLDGRAQHNPLRCEQPSHRPNGKKDAEFIVIDKENFRSIFANNPSIAESMSHILSERQAGLDAERERLDVTGLERRKKDVSGKLLSKVRVFFGMVK